MFKDPMHRACFEGLQTTAGTNTSKNVLQRKKTGPFITAITRHKEIGCGQRHYQLHFAAAS